ncbi:hypothetical protein Fmac_025313 [Flemingia macrophylla]|uniref:Disease resistance N-terminal domain-containing protein n=1 Tax=Flemingia macrophylla TaxID=520843 RepID=A0ABD1LTL1_9FABA
MSVVETLGGALFGVVLQVLFDRLDSRQVLDYFRGRKLDEKLLRKLKVKLLSINAVIDDAEQKQFNNSYVKAWLDELRDTVLDAEDLLDEIDYEFCKWEMEAESHTNASKVCNFDIQIESRMKEVLEKLEFLLSQKGDLDLNNASGADVESISGSKVTQKGICNPSQIVTEFVHDDDAQVQKFRHPLREGYCQSEAWYEDEIVSCVGYIENMGKLRGKTPVLARNKVFVGSSRFWRRAMWRHAMEYTSCHTGSIECHGFEYSCSMPSHAPPLPHNDSPRSCHAHPDPYFNNATTVDAALKPYTLPSNSTKKKRGRPRK